MQKWPSWRSLSEKKNLLRLWSENRVLATVKRGIFVDQTAQEKVCFFRSLYSPLRLTDICIWGLLLKKEQKDTPQSLKNCWLTWQIFYFFAMHCLWDLRSPSSLCLTLCLSHTQTQTDTDTAVSGSQWGRCPLTPYLIVLMWVGNGGSRNVTLSFSLLLLFLFFLEVDLADPPQILPCHVSLLNSSNSN